MTVQASHSHSVHTNGQSLPQPWTSIISPITSSSKAGAANGGAGAAATRFGLLDVGSGGSEDERFLVTAALPLSLVIVEPLASTPTSEPDGMVETLQRPRAQATH